MLVNVRVMVSLMMAQTFGSAEDADLSGVGNVEQNSIQIKKIRA